MTFIEEIKQRAKQDIKTIVLPEAQDIRILQATEIALREKYANIVLIGNKEKILEKAETSLVSGAVFKICNAGLKVSAVEWIAPETSPSTLESVSLTINIP